MLVQKTVTTNTNFAGRLSEWMLRKTRADSKGWSAKTRRNFASESRKNASKMGRAVNRSFRKDDGNSGLHKPAQKAEVLSW